MKFFYFTFFLYLVFQGDFSEASVSYRTFLGSCPSRSAGNLTLRLSKEFEKSSSLRSVKKLIIDEKLDKKYFVSEYKITYDPNRKLLKFHLDCPEPLLNVQVFKKDGFDSYNAILVEGGKLLDPTYAVLLKTEGKLKKDLPSLAIPLEKIDNFDRVKLASVIKASSGSLRDKISEIIIGEREDLTTILSIKGHPLSAFLGEEKWDLKFEKLDKILAYLEKKKKFPAVINLTNDEKIVVKFSDKF